MNRAALAVVPDHQAPTPEEVQAGNEKVLTMAGYEWEARGLAARTIKEHLIFLRKMSREGLDFMTCTRREIVFWMAGQDWSNSTRVHRKAQLYGFFTWMQDEELRLDNPAAKLPKVKAQKQKPNPFTAAEVQKLLDSGIYFKTQVMVCAHYYLGLRVSEIAAIHGSHIDWDTRTLTTVGKGRKEAQIPIPSHMWEVVTKMPRDAYWFPNRTANRMFPAGEGHITGNSISGLLAEAIKRAGIKHRPHQLRAATATEMHRAGVSAFTIQEGMRHSLMQTTTVYLTIDPEQVRAGLEMLPAVTMPGRKKRSA